jgi:HK97 gp10 family phage protein
VSIDASELTGWGRDLLGAAVQVPVESAALVATAAHEVEGRAKGNAPVLTGELRGSIHAVQVGASAWEVRADSDHSEYVEDGTSVMAPEPYMAPAFDAVAPGMETQAAAIVVKAIT